MQLALSVVPTSTRREASEFGQDAALPRRGEQQLERRVGDGARERVAHEGGAVHERHRPLRAGAARDALGDLMVRTGGR